MIDAASAATDIGDPPLPPEPPDGSWLLVPSLHHIGYGDVLRRDDASAYTDPERAVHGEHWFSFHRHAWIDWSDAVRLGAAMATALRLVDPAQPGPDPVSCPECGR